MKDSEGGTWRETDRERERLYSLLWATSEICGGILLFQYSTSTNPSPTDGVRSPSMVPQHHRHQQDSSDLADQFQSAPLWNRPGTLLMTILVEEQSLQLKYVSSRVMQARK